MGTWYRFIPVPAPSRACPHITAQMHRVVRSLWERASPRTAHRAARLCGNPDQHIRRVKLHPHHTAIHDLLGSQPVRISHCTQGLPVA
ncbi:hypothetical protein D3C76_1512330 [compost metagenome]